MSYIFSNIFTRFLTLCRLFGHCVKIIFSHEEKDMYAYLERKSWLHSEKLQFSIGSKIHTQFEI